MQNNAIQAEKTFKSKYKVKQSVCFSPDSKTFAMLDSRNCVLIYTISKKPFKLLIGLNVPFSIEGFAYSPCGLYLAIFGNIARVYLYQTNNFQLQKLIPITKNTGPLTLVFSEDSKYAVLGYRSGQLEFIDIQKEPPLQELLQAEQPTQNLVTAHIQNILGIAFKPKDKIFATCSQEKSIKLWDLESRYNIAEFKGSLSEVHSIAFEKNRGLMVSGGGDEYIRVWDVVNQKQVCQFGGNGSTILSVAISGDAKLIASAEFSGTVKLWSLKEQRLLKTIPKQNTLTRRVAFSSSGKILATASDDLGVSLYNTDTLMR